jgi:hypothetical protein
VTAPTPGQLVVLQVSPEVAAMLTRFQQLRSQGGQFALIDLVAMTLMPVGSAETLPRPRPPAPTLYTKPER